MVVALTAETGMMQGYEESDCSWEERNEIDPYELAHGDLNVCELLYPDHAVSGW